MDNKINKSLQALFETIQLNPSDLAELSTTKIKSLKNIAVNSQDFDTAVVLRDEEKRRLDTDYNTY